MTDFFTSDLHFTHTNCIRFCNRPYTDASHMDDSIINNINSKVTDNDRLFILGDFAFCDEASMGKLIERINGQKFLVYGNHDVRIKGDRDLQKKFIKCIDYLEVNVKDEEHPHGKQFMVLSHYPMMSWNRGHRGSFHLHGHSHGTMKYPFDAKILDVGIDCHDYMPLSYEEIKVIMATKGNDVIDGH